MVENATVISEVASEGLVGSPLTSESMQLRVALVTEISGEAISGGVLSSFWEKPLGG